MILFKDNSSSDDTTNDDVQQVSKTFLVQVQNLYNFSTSSRYKLCRKAIVSCLNMYCSVNCYCCCYSILS